MTEVLSQRRFEGRTVFITGGARPQGMSFATARLFLSEGARVFLYDCNKEALPESAKALGSSELVGWANGDVRSRQQLEAALDLCERNLGHVDILINHAGIGPSQHLLALEPADWTRVITTNLTGALLTGQAAASRMAQRKRGVILNMSSTGGIATEPGHSHYAASKAGILGLTKWMAEDLAPHGLRVFAICPGDVDTYDWGNVELARIYRLGIAAGRSGKPEEIAAVYLYLASEDAKHINGSAFIVDGGMLAWE